MTLYCRILLTDAYGIEHDIVPQGNGPVMQLSLPYGNAAKSFSFTLQDVDAAVMAWLAKGNIVRVYCDSSSPPTTLRLTGMVEDILRAQHSVASLRLTVSGRERSYVRMLERVVIDAYLNMAPSSIIHDLLANYLPYPADTVLAMSFYEGTGAIAHDGSRSSNVGAVDGASWVTGHVGNALSFDGSNDRVTLTSPITLTGPFTIMFWAKRTDTGTYDIALGHSTYTCKVGYNTGANTAFLRIVNGGDLATPAVSAAGNWEMLTVTRDGLGKIDFSVNGGAPARLYGDAAQAGDFTFNMLGDDESGNFFKGIMDELRVWNRALSPQEVKDCYDSGYLHNISPHVDTAIEVIRFNYKTFKDSLDVLATASNSKYYWTPTEALIFIEDVTVDSALDYADADISRAPSALFSLVPVKNRLYLIGGIYKETDQSQTLIGA